MEYHQVSKLLRKALEELKGLYDSDVHDMRIAADSQWWLAMAMLDHCRPAAWFRSEERARHSAMLSKICDEFTPKEAVAEAG